MNIRQGQRGTILTACNCNENYIGFIPLFIKTWKQYDIDILIVLIAEEIPKEYQIYKDYIELYPPHDNIPTALIAQCIRLYYPARLNGPVMITDIDIFPLRRSYFKPYLDGTKDLSQGIFINTRDISRQYNEQTVICYNVAEGTTWADVMEVPWRVQIHRIKIEMKKIWHLIHQEYEIYKKGWGTDQHLLYQKLQKYKGIIIMEADQNKQFNRLNRNTFPANINFIIKNKKKLQELRFVDYHAVRPPIENMELNEMIIHIGSTY